MANKLKMSNFIEIEYLDHPYGIETISVNISEISEIHKASGGCAEITLRNNNKYPTQFGYKEFIELISMVNQDMKIEKRCSDERPCMNCFPDQDEPLSYHKEESFKNASEPLIKWLAENAHPHHSVIVTATGAELLEGEISHQTNEFLVD